MSFSDQIRLYLWGLDRQRLIEIWNTIRYVACGSQHCSISIGFYDVSLSSCQQGLKSEINKLVFVLLLWLMCVHSLWVYNSVSMYQSPQENIACEFVLTSPKVERILQESTRKLSWNHRQIYQKKFDKQLTSNLDSMQRITWRRIEKKPGKTADLNEIPPEEWKTEIWRRTSSIIQICEQTKHNREMGKRLHPSLPQQRWPQNY